jgi:hypothetical protein
LTAVFVNVSLSKTPKEITTMSKMIRGYHVSNRAFYKDVVKGPRMMIGMYDSNDEGCSGEFEIKWVELDKKLCPEICMFDDSWKLLKEFSDLFEELAKLNEEAPTQDEMISLLNSLKFKDLTAYEYHKRTYCIRIP